MPFTSDGAVYNIDQERLAEDTRLADVHLCKYLHSIGGANGQSLDQQQSLAFIEHALAVSDRLFDQHSPAQTLVEFLQHTENEMKMDGGSAVDAEMEQIIIDNYAFMKARGHYLPGVTYMQPTFYWGVDRLFYLEKRLHELDLARDSNDSGAIVFNQNYTLRINAMSEEEIQSMKAMMGTKKEPSHDLVMYYSFRSPYSQLAIERFYDVARAWGVNPVIKPVLPMVIRWDVRYLFICSVS